MTILHKKIHPQELKEIVDFAMQNDSDSESEIKNNAVIYFDNYEDAHEFQTIAEFLTFLRKNTEIEKECSKNTGYLQAKYDIRKALGID